MRHFTGVYQERFPKIPRYFGCHSVREGGSPFQICFFAGVRFLLLKGVGHELGSIYRNAREGVSPDYESSFSCFKSVYLEYRHELKELINSLLIQTTVPGRCTYLMRVFDYVWRLSKRIL